MTTHNTSNFVHELVTMAQAVEELPKLQAEIARLQALVQSQEFELSARETHIEMLRDSNVELSSKLRSAEVERDNAGFRELAATDALDNIKKVMQTTFHNLGETLKAVQPVVEPTPTVVVDPFVAVQTDTSGTPTDSSGAGADPVPTAPTTTDPWPPVLFGTADASGGASSGTEGSLGQGEREPDPTTPDGESGSKPYAGKIYYDMPKYLTEAEWLTGGGSYEGYHWRPHFGARPAA